MPTYDASVRTVTFNAKYASESIAAAFDGSDRDDLALDLADQLLAATQEVERLTRENEALCKLVGEDESRTDVPCETCGAAIGVRCSCADVIRHAAGVGEFKS